MTGAAAYKDALRDPIVHTEISRFQIRTSSERGDLTVIVRVEVPCERGALVDRDHDHLLREFMEASDEVEAAAIEALERGGAK